MCELIKRRLQESIELKKAILGNVEILNNVADVADEISSCIGNGGKLVLCGNGGSAADALHFAGEIVGRFQKERVAWPAVVLNADVATMTAVANDYSFEDVFARQAEGHLTDRDFLIGISTSGNSENVYRAIQTARQIGAKTAALLGKDGGKIGVAVNYPIIIPGATTARIQEGHITLIHIICELVENKLA